MEANTVEVSASVVECMPGATHHLVDRHALACTICNLPIEELRCPDPPGHDKVYSHNVDIAQMGGMLRKWICRVCLTEGTEPFPDAQEYQILKARKLGLASGGPLDDSPVPDMRVEYPLDHLPKRKDHDRR